MQDRIVTALADRYRIERELGAGGMATVYLAQDIRHDRKVAIKVLKPELAAVIGGERFLAEIRTTASLQHPHILPLFDSGEADGFLFYVMPFVDGESLRDRLDREKQLGVEDAVRIAGAVASALHYAHERGIVHRDIKPANILIHADHPVVADFGIALAISAAGGGRLTETGMSVGTPHYMSPEQASADRDVSARSDIYSLGCVLYECLAGEPPHTGSTAQAVLLRILTEEPRDIGQVRKSVPAHVRDALARALEKLPADRFDSADAFRRALTDESFRYRPKAGAAAGSGADGRAGTSGAGRSLAIRVLAAANLLLVAALAWVVLSPGTPTQVGADAPPHRYAIADPDLRPGGFDVSRNGDVAYTALTDGRFHVRLRRANDTAVVELQNSMGGISPTFSPDGRWVAFTIGDAAEAELRKVEINTGAAVTLIPAGVVQASNPSWSGDGRILFTGPSTATIMAVPDTGGDVEVLREDSAATFAPILYPRILPDGRTLLFTLFDSLDASFSSKVVMEDLVTGDTRTLVASGGNAIWSPTGHILYCDPNGAILALPFDLERRTVTGSAVPVLQDVVLPSPFCSFSISATGTLAFSPTSPGFDPTLTSFAWLDASGAITPIPIEPTRIDLFAQSSSALSPDGRRVVYVRDDDLYLYDLATDTNVRFTFDGTPVRFPIWSADGTRIAFASRPPGTGTMDIRARDVNGRSPAELLYGGDRDEYPSQWLADGTLVFLARDSDQAPADILMLRPEATEPTVLLGGAADPVISPDGSLVAYSSYEGGVPQLYVREFPGMGGPWQVSAGFAYNGRWSPDGRAIVYSGSGGQLVRARLQFEPAFRTDRTNLTTEAVFNQIIDIHPDGRILVSRPAGMGGSTWHPTLVVVANWFTELRSRLRDSAR